MCIMRAGGQCVSACVGFFSPSPSIFLESNKYRFCPTPSLSLSLSLLPKVTPALSQYNFLPFPTCSTSSKHLIAVTPSSVGHSEREG